MEAEFVGVEGRSVVLRLADGSTKNVPIERLSDVSRNRAKQLDEAAKSKPAAARRVVAEPATPNATSRSTTPSIARNDDEGPLQKDSGGPTVTMQFDMMRLPNTQAINAFGSDRNESLSSPFGNRDIPTTESV
ncbi:hypothetical protein [Stieleria neptunia]|uniref:hypothetical protein n=1 Tax=Stieleria neptunia TaxID=2527979 RepID=UPI0036F44992